MGDTQAYIHMDCKGGNPVSAPGVGGNGSWQKYIVALTLKRPSGFVCLALAYKFILKNKDKLYLDDFCFYQCSTCLFDITVILQRYHNLGDDMDHTSIR